MLHCRCCGAAYEAEDYSDPSEACDDICPDCFNSGAYLETDDETNDSNERFENDALDLLENDPDLSQEELDDILSGPDDDEEDDYIPNEDDESDFGDSDRDNF